MLIVLAPQIGNVPLTCIVIFKVFVYRVADIIDAMAEQGSCRECRVTLKASETREEGSQAPSAYQWCRIEETEVVSSAGVVWPGAAGGAL